MLWTEGSFTQVFSWGHNSFTVVSELKFNMFWEDSLLSPFSTFHFYCKAVSYNPTVTLSILYTQMSFWSPPLHRIRVSACKATTHSSGLYKHFRGHETGRKIHMC